MLLVLSLSQAQDSASEQTRFLLVDYLDQLAENTSIIDSSGSFSRLGFQNPENTSPPGRIGAYVPPDMSNQDYPLRGSFIPDQDGFSYYVLLDDPVSDNFTYSLQLLESNSAAVIAGKPILLQQQLRLTSLSSSTQLHRINLWNHLDDLDGLAVQGSQSISVFVDDTFYSEQPIFELLLDPGESKTIVVEYEHAPLKQNVVCEDKQLADLLPSGAIIQYTDISLETVLSSSCTVTITHPYAQAVIVPILVNLTDHPYLEGITGIEQSTKKSVKVNNLTLQIEP